MQWAPRQINLNNLGIFELHEKEASRFHVWLAGYFCHHGNTFDVFVLKNVRNSYYYYCYSSNFIVCASMACIAIIFLLGLFVCALPLQKKILQHKHYQYQNTIKHSKQSEFRGGTSGGRNRRFQFPSPQNIPSAKIFITGHCTTFSTELFTDEMHECESYRQLQTYKIFTFGSHNLHRFNEINNCYLNE